MKTKNKKPRVMASSAEELLRFLRSQKKRAPTPFASRRGGQIRGIGRQNLPVIRDGKGKPFQLRASRGKKEERVCAFCRRETKEARLDLHRVSTKKRIHAALISIK